jgi:putative protease
MNRKDFEIMAPVGSRESLSAALQAGADSVYFGLGQLNMRSASSMNFTIEDLQEIVACCRQAGVRTYLTLNAVMYDQDMPQIQLQLEAASRCGVDAVIASDMSVVMAARSLGLSCMPPHN